MTNYDILGISRSAKETEIKKAYHQMIIAFHPDKYQGDKQFAAKKANEIIEAYNVLRNPAARKKYDEYLDSQARSTSAQTYRSTPASASGYRRPKDEKWKHMLRGMSTWKIALLSIGILFVIFAVIFFIMILAYIGSSRF